MFARKKKRFHARAYILWHGINFNAAAAAAIKVFYRKGFAFKSLMGARFSRIPRAIIKCGASLKFRAENLGRRKRACDDIKLCV